MKLKVTGKDALSWLAHSAGITVIIGIIGYTTGSYAAGYAFGLCVYFLKEVLQQKTVEIWNWSKLDSILDFVFPMVVGGIVMRYYV